ncbi:MAG: cysteine hydrolase [Pseudomonadota bacterium]
MFSRALLIIDMLNDYLDRWQPDARVALIEAINDLIAAFRSHRLPVIWVRQEFKADLSDAFPEMRSKSIAITIEGTRGAQLADALHSRADDQTIIKKRYSAFFETSLSEILDELGVTELILCGINTHACIRTTAIDAYQRDLQVIIATDCIGSYDAEHARISLDYMSDRIATLLSNSKIKATL